LTADLAFDLEDSEYSDLGGLEMDESDEARTHAVSNAVATSLLESLSVVEDPRDAPMKKKAKSRVVVPKT
jgi:hypothetical protein